MTLEPNDADRRVDGVTSAAMPAEAYPVSTIDATVTTSLAFDTFYSASRTGLARALALTLGDPELATEAVDEALARAYQRWSHVSQLDNPGGWVYRVALNWSRSILRRRNRPAPLWLTGNAHYETAPADPAIDRALSQLSVEQRAVVVCRVLLGYSEAQTMKILDLRTGTVKSRLARSLDRLRALLGNDTNEGDQ